MLAQPYDKDLIELMNWLRKNKLQVRVPKKGPIRFYYNPKYWEKFKEELTHEPF
jgi:hypothetical protein